MKYDNPEVGLVYSNTMIFDNGGSSPPLKRTVSTVYQLNSLRELSHILRVGDCSS